MLSLKERIDLLEQDLQAKPPRISFYRDLPFAILRYDPPDEWVLRREVRLLATRLEGKTGRKVSIISLADLLWEAIERAEGLEAVVELERQRGFGVAQAQVASYLSDTDWCPLARLLEEKMRPLESHHHFVFLVRAASMAPALYPISRLLDEMQGRTELPTVLFYPGTLEGTVGLRFMALKEREPMGNYRVKIYG